MLDKNNDILKSIKKHLPDLNLLLEETPSHWGGEDLVYRFYHQSFKAYYLQEDTEKVVALFREIGENIGLTKLNCSFEQIISEGTKKKFTLECNKRWLEETRPIVEAFFHTVHMLKMMVQYGESLEEAPRMLPSGWATVLYLYNVR